MDLNALLQQIESLKSQVQQALSAGGVRATGASIGASPASGQTANAQSMQQAQLGVTAPSPAPQTSITVPRNLLDLNRPTGQPTNVQTMQQAQLGGLGTSPLPAQANQTAQQQQVLLQQQQQEKDSLKNRQTNEKAQLDQKHSGESQQLDQQQSARMNALMRALSTNRGI